MQSSPIRAPAAILKNLLSNAFKFTEKGRVSLLIKAAEKRSKFTLASLESG
jgi:signal transduction histidine kinase